MGQLLGALKGYKTYAVVIVGFVVGGLSAVGVITQEQALQINLLLAPLGLGFLRAAVK